MQSKKVTSWKKEHYALLAAAFLVGRETASAEVIVTDVDPDQMVANGSFDIDMNADGLAEFTVQQAGSISAYGGIYFGYELGQLYANSPGSHGIIAESGFSIRPLSSGELIGPSAAFDPDSFATFGLGLITGLPPFDPNLIGMWAGQTDKYVGVRFEISSEIHYGWIRCDVGPFFDFINVKSFAYEANPETPIAAGDTVGIADCNSSTPPQNPLTVLNTSSAVVSWDPVISSQACQIKATRLFPAGGTSSVVVPGFESSSRTVPFDILGNGSVWEWSVRCACTISPFDATAFSAKDTIAVPALRTSGELYPNPASKFTTLQTEGLSTKIEIIDLSGRLVDYLLIPEGDSAVQIDVSELNPGIYILKVEGRKSEYLQVTH